ncbi:MAG TPA: VapC toxin family PIN domain ribonuclease [Chloroflexi bacterium]|nr:VapC toxin family PIN domain ribonuclease [Chloroflexota bacterium]HHW86667.1 type II toxin-antitoxin system VapC family toxin [Chloroflexota bacterium]
MNYLVDTDWIVDYLKGRTTVVERLRMLAPDGLAVSLISYGEIYEGIYFGRNPEQHESGFRNFLRGVMLLPLDRAIMRRFARVRGDLRRKGLLIGDPDLLIAATALHYDLTLLTHNALHFRRITGLRMEDNASEL